MSLYYVFCALILFATVLSYINHKFIRWPWPIGVTFLSLLLSFMLLFLSSSFPSFTALIQQSLLSINFYNVVIKVFLGFILFSGAFKVDVEQLRGQIKPVLALALLGTLISVFVVGYVLFFTLQLLGIGIPLIHCFLFGTLISPTDPVAVIGILRRIGIAPVVQMKIMGESLFNDAIAIVIFSSLYEAANLHENIHFGRVLLLFVLEVGGGLLLGSLLAAIGFFALKSVDNYEVEILITVVLVMVGYTIADWIGVSGPISMVIAGLVTGSRTRQLGMSDKSEKYVSSFWELLEDFMNLILFLMIGLELLVIPHNWMVYLAGCFVIVIVLMARLAAVAVPVFIFHRWFKQDRIILLTWCGLRGGISIALALSLTREMERPFFVILTYIVAVFSIVVQGLTMKKVAGRLKVVE